MTRKLSPHILYSYRGSLGRPPVCKLVDASVETIIETRQRVGPQCLLVVRWETQQQPLDDPVQRARDWFGRHNDTLWRLRGLRPLIVEGYNEIGDGQAGAYAQFERERVDLLHSIGLYACVGDWSVGVPDIPAWATYQGLVESMKPGDALGLHEYWIDESDLNNRWHVRRWSVPDIANRYPWLRDVPKVVTECGRDRVENRGQAGWRRTCNRERFMQDLREVDELYSADPSVLGVCVFTIGEIRDPQWRPFDCNDLWPQVVAEQAPGEQTPAEQTPAEQGTPALTGHALSGPEQPLPMPDVAHPLIMPIVNIAKAWYSADEIFGVYDGHPSRARDWNLETGGNTDLGEPLQAPCDGSVVYAGDAGGAHGIVVSFVAVVDGQLVNWHWKHLLRADVRQWQRLKRGERIGAIGNAGGQYSAHLHEEVLLGSISGPTQDWRDISLSYTDPAVFYIAHGVPEAQVKRMFLHDGR